MCGIIACVGRQAREILLRGLTLLEYRGHDSVGIAIHDGTRFQIAKKRGKLSNLVVHLEKHFRDLDGQVGIGHTRWATHGGVSDENAHPHHSCDERIAVVHNGIIENYAELKRGLRGHRFVSQTDTEVVAHLVEKHYRGDPRAAVLAAARELRGAYALVIGFADHPDRLYGARLNAPLVVGLPDPTHANGGRGAFLASDLHAVLPYTRRVAAVEEHRVVEVTATQVRAFDLDGNERELRPFEVNWTSEVAEKSGYPTFMLKEIFEQADTTGQELQGRVNIRRAEVNFEGASLNAKRLRRIRRVVIAACGTSWHAGLAIKCAMEQFARLPTECGLASELRYGEYPFGPDTLTIALSQSGETADTLAALRTAHEAGSRTLAVTNIRGSSIAREADDAVYMRARLEIGVAATKTYTSQLMCGLLLALQLGKIRGTVSLDTVRSHLQAGLSVPGAIERVLQQEAHIRCLAQQCKSDFMFIGRHYNLGTAYEGALKMKEISYLHAEGYGAGEMKHGPLALVDDRLTTVAIAPQGRVHDKMISNIQQIASRKGQVFSVCTAGDSALRSMCDGSIEIPQVHEMWSPVVAVVPLQLLAYHKAKSISNDLDVDQPRNLAKSVTVE